MILVEPHIDITFTLTVGADKNWTLVVRQFQLGNFQLGAFSVISILMIDCVIP